MTKQAFFYRIDALETDNYNGLPFLGLKPLNTPIIRLFVFSVLRFSIGGQGRPNRFVYVLTDEPDFALNQN